MIDLRSDILGGIPDAASRAFLEACADPPSFDLDEDPHQNALEDEVAGLFGFERALFMSTGTMANQVAIRIRCAPGKIVLADRDAHVAVNEAASTAGLNGAALHLLAGERGHLAPRAVADALETLPRSRADRRVGLVWLENTHNRAGGTVMPAGWGPTIGSAAKAHGVPVHLDGARIWNALVATAGASVDGIGTAIAPWRSMADTCVSSLPWPAHAGNDEYILWP